MSGKQIEVEIYFPNHFITLPGRLFCAEGGRICVRLLTEVLTPGLLTPGNPVRLTIHTPTHQHMLETRICGGSRSVVELEVPLQMVSLRKRQYVRRELTAAVLWRPVEDKSEWRYATMLDISEGGLRMRCLQPVEVGEELELEFALYGDDQPIQARGRVAWQRESAGEQWEMGIEFTQLPRIDRIHIRRLVGEI
jgi:Tfp pilus assembly protein PilZ